MKGSSSALLLWPADSDVSIFYFFHPLPISPSVPSALLPFCVSLLEDGQRGEKMVKEGKRCSKKGRREKGELIQTHAILLFVLFYPQDTSGEMRLLTSLVDLYFPLSLF